MIRSALLALTVVSAMALSGCQIYFGPPNEDPPPNCGPWGCEPEPPPGTPGGDCNYNEDCQQGCFCNDEGTCEESGFCEGDWDCSYGFICDVDRATCVPGEPNPGWCFVNEDCPDGYCDIWSGVCAPSWECFADDDCGDDWTCDGRGICVPVQCDENTDCSQYSYCDTNWGQCIPSWSCFSDEECGYGMECDDRGTCVPTTCTDHAECGEGSYCDVYSGQCIWSGYCESDDWCWDGLFCNVERFTCEPLPPATCYGEVFCDAAPPECPEGTTPGIANNCYTGECIPLELCEEPPPPPPAACEELATEDECYGRADCTATYVGVNCTCQGGGADCRCDSPGASCTCERFDYAGCLTL
jgi:hypothetical protein